jgi:hypothetical protein
VDPQPRGPDWMQITPKAGSLFHAYAQSHIPGDGDHSVSEEWRDTRKSRCDGDPCFDADNAALWSAQRRGRTGSDLTDITVI